MVNSVLSKIQKLTQTGTLNPNAEVVNDGLFQTDEFFDSHDLVQVKYEMIRRVQKDGWSVSESAKAYGFSRVSFYEIQRIIEQEGLIGLLPRQRGPKTAHKLTNEILDFIEQTQQKISHISFAEIAVLVQRHFNIKIHPRSIERTMTKKKTKKEPVG